MDDLTKFDDVVELSDNELETITSLGVDEYLLKVTDNGVGFMTKLTKEGTIPTVFRSWRQTWFASPPMKTYKIVEKYRRDWKFICLRHGQSTAWVVLQHPYGFSVEINSKAFQQISSDITMVNGRMVTPCYFDAKLKNAKLLVKKDPGQEFFFSLIKAISDDEQLIEKLRDIIEDERPDKVYGVLSSK